MSKTFIFSDLVVVLMVKLLPVGLMAKDAMKINPAKMDLSVVVQIRRLLHKVHINKVVSNAQKRYVKFLFPISNFTKFSSHLVQFGHVFDNLWKKPK